MTHLLVIETRPRGKHTLTFKSEEEADAALDEVLQHMNETDPATTVKIAGQLLLRVGDISSAAVREDTFGLLS